MPLAEGRIIANHVLVKKLGGGAFGEVWLVRHVELNDERAMKIPTDPDYVKQLRMEGKVQFSLHHPNIVQTLDLNTSHDPPYFLMEYVAGSDLRKKLKAQGKLPIQETMPILMQILEALAAAHSDGVLHRDLKPENILITPKGQVKVADFGLGKVQAAVERSLSLSGKRSSADGGTVGTYEYMSPEQKQGQQADQRDDLYAAGIIACELFTGAVPSAAGAARLFQKAGVAQLAPAVEKALLDRDERYASARAMSAAITSAVTEMQEAQRREEEKRRAAETERRERQEEERRRQAEERRLQEEQRQREEEKSRRRSEEWNRPTHMPPAYTQGSAPQTTARVVLPARRESKPGVWVLAGAVALVLVFILVYGMSSGGPPVTVTQEARAGRDYAILTFANGVKMEFVKINPGTFMMGSPLGEEGRSNDETQHRVTITKAFYMGVTEVTLEQYEALTGTNPSHFNGAKKPVETVSWDDAVEFCTKLSERSGKAVRLPTEAQWEYACRAGATGPYAGSGKLDDMAWHNGYRSGDGSRPVATKQANAWGLYDMHGNAWEWCADWYAEYGGSAVTDPVGPSSGASRVVRGGSWRHDPQHCRAACRIHSAPGSRSDYIGFRVALDFP